MDSYALWGGCRDGQHSWHSVPGDDGMVRCLRFPCDAKRPATALEQADKARIQAQWRARLEAGQEE